MLNHSVWKSLKKSHSTFKAYGQTVIPDRSILIGQKIVKMPKFKNSMRHFEWFLNIEPKGQSSTLLVW